MPAKPRSGSSPSPARRDGSLHVGIGGWSYAPWHETFFPKDLPRRRALSFVGQTFNAVEVNATFYGSQKPETFARWREETPADFLFALKAPRVATHRSSLASSASSIERFVNGGITRLGAKLGPLLWQFPPAKSFEPKDFEDFLALLPKRLERRRLRHVVDVRHASFAAPEFVALCRKYAVAICVTDARDVPQLRDTSSDFVYLRLRDAQARLKQGYPTTTLNAWVADARSWRLGKHPSRGKLLCEADSVIPRDTFVFFINGAKERAPAAAQRFQKLAL